jgi:hypothetical protein
MSVRLLKEIDSMGGSSFDLIVQELQTQQHIMEEMKAENHKLHQQIAALRTGQGIFLEINGTRMALDTQVVTTAATNSQQSIVPPVTPTQPSSKEDIKPSNEQMPLAEQSNNNEDRKIKDAEIIPEAAIAAQPEQEKDKRPSTFLEEIMLDEFASALTAPTAIQQVPEQEPTVSKEEQKAALRRELIGSFLLE